LELYSPSAGTFFENDALSFSMIGIPHNYAASLDDGGSLMTLTMLQPLPAGVRTIIIFGMVASLKANEPATGHYSGSGLFSYGTLRLDGFG
jgi:hypothetical protein